MAQWILHLVAIASKDDRKFRTIGALRITFDHWPRNHPMRAMPLMACAWLRSISANLSITVLSNLSPACL